jgi:hypothetical protein
MASWNLIVSVPAVCAFSFLTLCILVICFISWRKDLDRTKRMERIARQLGLRFQSRAGFSLLGLEVPFGGGVTLGPELSPFRLCPSGEQRPPSSTGIRNLMQGQIEGHSMWLFDYYSGHGGKGSHSYWSLVLYFRSEELSLPRFSLRTRCGGSQGGIILESNPEFSEKHLLEGHEEALIRQLFDQAERSFFDTHADLNVEGDGERLIVYRITGANAWQRADPEMIPRLLDEALEILSLTIGINGKGIPRWLPSILIHSSASPGLYNRLSFFTGAILMAKQKHPASESHLKAAAHHAAAAHHHFETAHEHADDNHEEAKKHAAAALDHSQDADRHSKTAHVHSQK